MVGTGPGSTDYLSPKALRVLQEADIIVGYKTYVQLIAPLVEGKEIISTGMTREVERCRAAIAQAQKGRKVALVSSGDPGVYGMAGLALEILYQEKLHDLVEVEIIPGITAATAAAALLGAPLMHDFVVISLSDLLTPWELIEKRLALAAQGDFVIVLYNPASHRRKFQIQRAREILLQYKNASTPVGIVRQAYREEEEVIITDLENLLSHSLDMFSILIVGNNQTKKLDNYLVTPRGYVL
ncbi:cobalt-precorrin 3 C17-methyltransferase [Desulfofundulus australicus DSM 11792]|uniref:Cobalt-precorrin 3 C17-methyltransferase n=1 Tax=Desulfofundulus australicus DSM 11792 TaxID=1121425 RepID=A0A1M5BVY7_9FIRM|nr:precorrin-3B C(17)-methyltransferase [Desulfofundulus australicus]SHF46457.1 cobalt-precorrin 3 C17-methyltransferase [Desulfofundulus australicus DSM 11792]